MGRTREAIEGAWGHILKEQRAEMTPTLQDVFDVADAIDELRTEHDTRLFASEIDIANICPRVNALERAQPQDKDDMLYEQEDAEALVAVGVEREDPAEAPLSEKFALLRNLRSKLTEAERERDAARAELAELTTAFAEMTRAREAGIRLCASTAKERNEARAELAATRSGLAAARDTPQRLRDVGEKQNPAQKAPLSTLEEWLQRDRDYWWETNQRLERERNEAQAEVARLKGKLQRIRSLFPDDLSACDYRAFAARHNARGLDPLRLQQDERSADILDILDAPDAE